MACVASKIYAAPFAILGSIGVLAQMPNFNRMLDSHGVDFEQITAGKYKRTVTMFGKNTDEDRAKLKEELEDVHALFKDADCEIPAELWISRKSRRANTGMGRGRWNSASLMRSGPATSC